MADEPSQNVECEPEPAAGDDAQSTCVPNAPEPLRSETVWMPYGDIVLQAELTQFRVNRDILALQSSVFRDMFLVPQPADAPTVDGCPLVHLADDRADDWEILLDLLYDPYISETQLNLSAITVMLSLGRKYDMAKLWKHAVFCIRCDFPKEKSKFDLIQFNFDMPKKILSEAGSEVVLLNLADTHGIRTSIPTLALECLKKYSMDELINDKVVRRSGAPGVALHDRLKFMLSVAADRITQWQFKNYAWLELDNESVIPVDDCWANDCDEDRGKIHRVVMKGRAGERYLLLETWNQLGCNEFVCRPCLDAAEQRWNAERVVAWGNLPGWFGLPKWKALKDDVQ